GVARDADCGGTRAGGSREPAQDHAAAQHQAALEAAVWLCRCLVEVRTGLLAPPRLIPMTRDPGIPPRVPSPMRVVPVRPRHRRILQSPRDPRPPTTGRSHWVPLEGP